MAYAFFFTKCNIPSMNVEGKEMVNVDKFGIHACFDLG